MLEKVISGGQTGSDLAGVIVAKRYGLQTGGWMPKGFLNQSGPHPEYAELYGFKEHASPKYPPRTFSNVAEADATLRLACDFDSPGEKLTLKAIQQYKKPSFDVDLMNPKPPQQVVDWLNRFGIKVLNVAGNSERTWSGVTGEAADYLAKVFALLGLKEPNG